jgi:hypothetical protein
MINHLWLSDSNYSDGHEALLPVAPPEYAHFVPLEQSSLGQEWLGVPE